MSRQGRDSAGSEEGSRIEWVRETIAWRESLVAGIGSWLVGLAVTVVPLQWFGIGDSLRVETVDLAILIYIESIGGTVNEGAQVASLSAYGVFDSNAFGLGPAAHALVPAVVLLGGGYVLAGRHIETGATTRPLESILAGGSLALPFALAFVPSTVVATIGGTVSVDVGVVLVVALLYAGVFAATGGALRSRARLVSWQGAFAGIGAFAAVILAGIAGEESLGSRVADLSESGELLDYLTLLNDFFLDYAIEEGEILPALFVVTVPLVFGAALAYVCERRDPVVGAGEGARLGVTHAALVFLVVAGHIVALVLNFEQGGDWHRGQVAFVNELVATAPRTILLAGVVYPVAFAAVGGALGAVVYRTQVTTGRDRQEP